jgi:hypothetical protein
MLNSPESLKAQYNEYVKKRKAENTHQQIEVTTAGSSPPATVIEGLEKMGFNVTHVYGIYS